MYSMFNLSPKELSSINGDSFILKPKTIKVVLILIELLLLQLNYMLQLPLLCFQDKMAVVLLQDEYLMILYC